MKFRHCIVILALLCLTCTESVHVSQDQDGWLQIPADAFNGNTALSLQGPWEFYWGRLITPEAFHSANAPLPDLSIEKMRSWRGLKVGNQILDSSGRATYRIRLRSKKFPPEMGIRIVHQVSASRVYANGALISETGTIGNTVWEDVPERTDSMGFFKPESNQVELIFHISNAEVTNGGMRGTMVLGNSVTVKRYAEQRTIIEALVLGIVLGSAVYHLFFYFMHRNEYSFLFFSALCFVLALRIPLQGSKIYPVMFPPISWDAQVRFLALLTMISAPLIMSFLKGLFPDLVTLRVLVIYWIVAGCALFIPMASLEMVSLGNLIYISVLSPVVLAHMFLLLYRAARAGSASILMMVGAGSLVVLGCYAFFQNYAGREGGPYALAAIFFFVIFQALALSRFFLDAVRARSILAEQLQESYQALSRQREELQINLHDSLGGALTDLQIHTERQLASATEESKSVVTGIHDRISQTVRMFRSQLLFMEDLAMAAQETLPGIQMTLLRRYADAGREIDFDFSHGPGTSPEFAENFSFPVKRRLDLFFLIIEVCTNDLKYGKGESFWRISVSNRELSVIQKNGIKNIETHFREPVRAADRVRKLGGKMALIGENGEYGIEIRIPLRAET
ncbi:MAG: 7TM-DISM domain-containing protein [Spirochaetia bacterium]|nr:7TM-DISM domain-containing protein [Spirochaetia bacterium]